MKYERWMIGCVAVGALACATPAVAQMRSEGAGYSVEVLVDGVAAPTFWHRGQTYVLGQLGERYVVRVVNHSGRRVEAVVSVDGRDVIGGNTADYRRNRGYLVPAWGSVDIEGWRISQRDVAAFRFSPVRDSYAARMGNAREVGVIGVAVFPERMVYRPRPMYPYDVPSPSYDEPPPPWYGRGQKGKSEAQEPQTNAAPPPSASPPSVSEAPAPSADASGSARGDAPSRRSARPGLGTEFGEEMGSPVREVAFVRANPGRPAVVLGVRYDDRRGLMALGIDVDRGGWQDDTYLRQTARPFPAVSRGYAAPPPGWHPRW